MHRISSLRLGAVIGFGLAIILIAGCHVSDTAPETTASTDVERQAAGRLSADFVRPTHAQAESRSVRADHQQIEGVVHGIVAALNRDGEGLERFYLPDAGAVFYGPPGAGEEEVRTVSAAGERLEVTQAGVLRGDRVTDALAACLAAFREEGTTVQVIPNRDLEIRTLGELGFATLTGANVAEGGDRATAWRWTLVFERVRVAGGQRWAVVHDHLSFS